MKPSLCSLNQQVVTEEHIGLMLTCNVVVQESSKPGKITVSAINPVTSMIAVENAAIEPVLK